MTQQPLTVEDSLQLAAGYSLNTPFLDRGTRQQLYNIPQTDTIQIGNASKGNEQFPV